MLHARLLLPELDQVVDVLHLERDSLVLLHLVDLLIHLDFGAAIGHNQVSRSNSNFGFKSSSLVDRGLVVLKTASNGSVRAVLCLRRDTSH